MLVCDVVRVPSPAKASSAGFIRQAGIAAASIRAERAQPRLICRSRRKGSDRCPDRPCRTAVRGWVGQRKRSLEQADIVRGGGQGFWHSDGRVEASRGQRVAADIVISPAEIGFSFGSDDHAVNHLPCRVFPLQFVLMLAISQDRNLCERGRRFRRPSRR